jgi:F-type H+-transporting ATPase subunit alpha
MLYLGTSGFLDQLPIDRVLPFEKEFLEMTETRHKDLLDIIAEKKELTDDIIKRIQTIAREFMDTFSASA